jgi:hypothetical protein
LPLASGDGPPQIAFDSAGAIGPDLADPGQNPDLVGFAREFRAVFGGTDAPTPPEIAPSPIACLAAPARAGGPASEPRRPR